MKYLNTYALNAFHIQQCCIFMSNIPTASSNFDSLRGIFHLSIDKSPGWVRMAQIGLGAVILILSILVLLNPVMGGVSIIFILALLLFFAGIEKVVSGIIGRGKSRLASIGLGIIVIVISLIAMTYPEGATAVVVILLGIALLVDGISRIIHGLQK